MSDQGYDIEQLNSEFPKETNPDASEVKPIQLFRGGIDLIRGVLTGKDDDENLRTEVPSNQKTDTGVGVPNKYNSDDASDVELTRSEPFSTVIVSLKNNDIADDQTIDVRVREAPVPISEQPSNMSEDDHFHLLDETTGIDDPSVSGDGRYKQRFDVTGRSIQLQFKTNGSTSGTNGSVDYAIQLV